jgi:hypothetical protein
MTTVFDIDTFLREMLEPQHGTLGKVARHKLCYAVLRLGIGVTGDSPFDGRVVAWPLGPVFVDLWEHPDVEGDPRNIPPDVREICIVVAGRLGGIPGEKLAVSSHTRYPEWKIARGKLPAKRCGDNEITRELIHRVTWEQFHVEGHGKDQIITERASHDNSLAWLQWRELGFCCATRSTLFGGASLPFKERANV